jgi:hypothetical protein
LIDVSVVLMGEVEMRKMQKRRCVRWSGAGRSMLLGR